MSAMLYLDLAFYLAVGAIGWGLSLAAYHWIATRTDWPMGSWHRNRPWLPILLGVVAMSIGVIFSIARGSSNVPGALANGWAIAGFGIMGAILWTMILRVASQVSLILAPVAAGLLMVWWVGGPDALEYHTVRSEIRDLREALEASGVLTAPREDAAQPKR
jgi:hypothetical protein